MSAGGSRAHPWSVRGCYGFLNAARVPRGAQRQETGARDLAAGVRAEETVAVVAGLFRCTNAQCVPLE